MTRGTAVANRSRQGYAGGEKTGAGVLEKSLGTTTLKGRGAGAGSGIRFRCPDRKARGTLREIPGQSGASDPSTPSGEDLRQQLIRGASSISRRVLLWQTDSPRYRPLAGVGRTLSPLKPATARSERLWPSGRTAGRRADPKGFTRRNSRPGTGVVVHSPATGSGACHGTAPPRWIWARRAVESSRKILGALFATSVVSPGSSARW